MTNGNCASGKHGLGLQLEHFCSLKDGAIGECWTLLIRLKCHIQTFVNGNVFWSKVGIAAGIDLG